MAVAVDDPLVGGHLTQRHRTAGVELLRADAHLGAEAELGAVGELRGGVQIDGRRVYLIYKPLPRGVVLRNNRLAVPGAIVRDVVQRRLEVGHELDGHDVVEELGPVVALTRRLHVRTVCQQRRCPGIAAQLDVGALELVGQRG